MGLARPAQHLNAPVVRRAATASMPYMIWGQHWVRMGYPSWHWVTCFPFCTQKWQPKQPSAKMGKCLGILLYILVTILLCYAAGLLMHNEGKGFVPALLVHCAATMYVTLCPDLLAHVCCHTPRWMTMRMRRDQMSGSSRGGKCWTGEAVTLTGSHTNRQSH
jgi:hypothetical protein